MWIGLLAAWVLGSVSLYAYLVATAREPRHGECMDCRLSDCADCPYFAQSDEAAALDRAA